MVLSCDIVLYNKMLCRRGLEKIGQNLARSAPRSHTTQKHTRRATSPSNTQPCTQVCHAGMHACTHHATTQRATQHLTQLRKQASRQPQTRQARSHSRINFAGEHHAPRYIKTPGAVCTQHSAHPQCAEYNNTLATQLTTRNKHAKALHQRGSPTCAQLPRITTQ